MTVTTTDPKVILREWIGQKLEEQGEISASSLYDEAYATFGADEEFMQAVFAAALPTLLDEAMRSVMSRERARKGLVKFGDGVATEEHVQALMVKSLLRWYENSLGNIHVPLLRMTRSQLDYAIDQRQQQVKGHMRRIAFLQDLRSGLENDLQTIEECYTEAELAAIMRRHFS